MLPIPPEVLDTLDFMTAAKQEAETWRNLLPTEPGIEVLARDPARFARYARFRLEAGVASAPSTVVRARKPHQQTRPVPIVGIPERIAYRALCNEVLKGQPGADRSADAYVEFLSAPLLFALDDALAQERLDWTASGYVVESDIAAYYEYVNHARLLDELQLRTQTVGTPRLLVDLLGEIQGGPIGLPQLLDPSDELSEVYARIIERELKRSGIPVWRYNDDFKLFAATYEEAQSRLEMLAQEAARVGLILNEKKTVILKFERYIIKHWVTPPTEGDIEFRPELIRIHSDYGQFDGEGALELACLSLSRLDPSEESEAELDIKKLTFEHVKDFSRDFGILTKLRDDSGMAYVPRLFEYLPHLTARLGRYLMALSEHLDIGATWDQLVAREKVYNAWQRTWLVSIARQADLLQEPDRREWVERQRADSEPLLRAEATLSLSPFGSVTFAEIDRDLKVQPEALMPWYVLAVGMLPDLDEDRLLALKQGHGLIEAILQASLAEES